ERRFSGTQADGIFAAWALRASFEFTVTWPTQDNGIGLQPRRHPAKMPSFESEGRRANVRLQSIRCLATADKSARDKKRNEKKEEKIQEDIQGEDHATSGDSDRRRARGFHRRVERPCTG